MSNYHVEIEYDDEAGVYYISESDIKGLSLENESIKGLLEDMDQVIPELMELNNQN